MKRNIYVVTSGSYSDYSINAIFSSLRRADKYCAVHYSKYDYNEYEMEKYVLNEPGTRCLVQILYSSQVEIKSGKVIHKTYKNVLAPMDAPCPEVLEAGLPKCLCAVGHSYVSQEHAQKVATDYRMKMLAEQAEGLRDEQYQLVAAETGEE